MLHNVQQLKASVAGLLTGTNLGNITNLDYALERAARNVAQLVDAPEATGREAITLYSGVYYYRAPESIFGTAVNIIRPQGNVNSQTLTSMKVPIDVFTRGKYNFPNGYVLDLEYDKGIGVIGISSNVPLPLTILSTQSDADDWTATGSASTPITDNVNYWQNPASIRFNLAGASTGTLTSTINPVDLTSLEGVGVCFVAIQVPDASLLTSMNIRIGSSPTDYVSVTETEGFLGAWTSNTWLLVAFDLAGASETGTVDWENIDYIQNNITTSATINNFRLGGMWVAMPSINEIIYQTSAIFKTVAGVLTPNITSDNDTIILNDAAYTIYEYFSAKVVALQQSGGEYTTQIQGFDDVLYGNNRTEGLVGRYTANNPSTQLRTIDSYYNGEDQDYNKFW